MRRVPTAPEPPRRAPAAPLGPSAHSGGPPIPPTHRTAGATPICVAAGKGHFTSVKILAEEFGADASIAMEDEATPIYAAAYNARIKICRYLVNVCKVDVNSHNKDGATGCCVAGQVGAWVRGLGGTGRPRVSGRGGSARYVACSLS